MEQEQRQAAKQQMLALMQAGQSWQAAAAAAGIQVTSLVASSQVQKELQEQLGVRISISHLNAIRAAYGWSNVASQAGKKSQSS